MRFTAGNFGDYQGYAMPFIQEFRKVLLFKKPT